MTNSQQEEIPFQSISDNQFKSQQEGVQIQSFTKNEFNLPQQRSQNIFFSFSGNNNGMANGLNSNTNTNNSIEEQYLQISQQPQNNEALMINSINNTYNSYNYEKKRKN